MKTTLYYFSGTGNSLKIAMELAARIGNCSLVPIAKIRDQDKIVAETKRIGFISPLYYLGLAKIVLKFVKKIELTNVKYIFSVFTRGFPTVGGAIHQLKNLLRERFYTLSAGFYVRMPMNDIIFSNSPSKEKQKQIIAAAKKRIEKISSVINRNGRHFDKEPLYFMRSIRNTPFLERVNKDDRNYIVLDKCNSCRICEKVCPVGNIVFEDGRPKWKHHCEQCQACINLCPIEAIEFGAKTKGKQRYHHPDIRIKDLMEQKRY